MSIFKPKNNDIAMQVEQERKYILRPDTVPYLREAYNSLRSNITFSIPKQKKGCKIIGITSTLSHEGKSTTALNIAISFAEIGKKVLLVDCDLRRPKQHRLLDIKAVPGFSNYLVDDYTLEEVIRHIDEFNIDVICSGDIPPNSTQVLESENLQRFVETVSEMYDYVIIDTPPVDIVIDSCVVAQYTNGVIFVVRENYAKQDRIISAVKQIEFAGGKLIGFVLNGTTDKNLMQLGKYVYKSRYRYRYGYSYTKPKNTNSAIVQDSKESSEK